MCGVCRGSHASGYGTAICRDDSSKRNNGKHYLCFSSTCTHTCKHTWTHMHTNTQTQTNTNTNTHIHAHTNKHKHIHTCTHSHTHTCTHTHTQDSASELVNDLKSAVRDRMNEQDWMDDYTRMRAKEKVIIIVL